MYSAYKNYKEIKNKEINNRTELSQLEKNYLIFEEHNKINKYFSDIKVLSKIIIVPSIKSVKSYLLTKYVNTQNTIKTADYFSNQDYQYKVKKYLADPSQSKFNLFYEIKRGEKKFFDKEELNKFNKPFLNLENFIRNFWAIFNNPGISNISSRELFKTNEVNNNIIITTPIDKLLETNFELTIKKMLFSQFLLDGIKEELSDFIKLYDSYNNLFISSKINLIDTEIVWKLIDKINNTKIQAIKEDTNWTEGTLEPFNFIIRGKGKYIYSFFVKKLIEKVLNKNQQNGFDTYINSINDFSDLIYIKNISKQILHEANEIIQPMFLNSKKSEGQIVGTFNSIFIDKFDDLCDTYLLDIKNMQKIETLLKDNKKQSNVRYKKQVKPLKLKLNSEIIEDTKHIQVIYKLLEKINIEDVFIHCQKIFNSSFIILKENDKNYLASKHANCYTLLQNNKEYFIYIHSSKENLIKKLLQIKHILKLNLEIIE